MDIEKLKREKGFKCRNCGYLWLPRSNLIPKVCPKYKSWKWQVPEEVEK